MTLFTLLCVSRSHVVQSRQSCVLKNRGGYSNHKCFFLPEQDTSVPTKPYLVHLNTVLKHRTKVLLSFMKNQINNAIGAPNLCRSNPVTGNGSLPRSGHSLPPFLLCDSLTPSHTAATVPLPSIPNSGIEIAESQLSTEGWPYTLFSSSGGEVK